MMLGTMWGLFAAAQAYKTQPNSAVSPAPVDAP
jgi:hypothetical protein